MTRDGRPWSVAAGLVGSLMLAVYVVLLSNEGDDITSLAILPWVVVMGTASIAAWASALVQDVELAGRLAIVATLIFGAIGVLALMSVGFGFLVAAGMSMVAVFRMAQTTTG